MTQWHTHGEKQIEGNYKDEKRNELWQVWYENGQKNENNFKDGKLMSIVVWKPNGKKWPRFQFKRREWGFGWV